MEVWWSTLGQDRRTFRYSWRLEDWSIYIPLIWFISLGLHCTLPTLGAQMWQVGKVLYMLHIIHSRGRVEIFVGETVILEYQNVSLHDIFSNRNKVKLYIQKWIWCIFVFFPFSSGVSQLCSLSVIFCCMDLTLFAASLFVNMSVFGFVMWHENWNEIN